MPKKLFLTEIVCKIQTVIPILKNNKPHNNTNTVGDIFIFLKSTFMSLSFLLSLNVPTEHAHEIEYLNFK